MYQCFKKKRFSGENYHLIELCNGIIEEYISDGYQLTTRQLYYQLVARDYIPNTVESYNRIKNLINDARLAGEMDWSAIVDRGRVINTPGSWAIPSEILRSVVKSFKIDHWQYQPVHVMVMCEKQALEGVLQPAAEKWHLPYVSCKGYASVSLLYRLGREFSSYFRESRKIKIIYFGDHDPSGLDMDRDLGERLEMFSEFNELCDSFEIIRSALTIEQVLEYKPPPNPAKMSDTRSKSYIKRYGRSSWELDALEPNVLSKMLDEEIGWILTNVGSREIWEETKKVEQDMIKELKDYLKNSTSNDHKWFRVDEKLYGMRRK